MKTLTVVTTTDSLTPMSPDNLVQRSFRWVLTMSSIRAKEVQPHVATPLTALVLERLEVPDAPTTHTSAAHVSLYPDGYAVNNYIPPAPRAHSWLSLARDQMSFEIS